MRGFKDDDIESILDFCAERGFPIRLIETMPMGSTGRAAMGAYLDLGRIKERLEQRFALIPDILPGGGPARYYRVGGSDTRIGFITPLSQHFCATCNRVRLAADGTLHLCLGQENSYPLRPLLRDGIDDAGLDAHLRQAIVQKPERHEFGERPEKIFRVMARTGG